MAKSRRRNVASSTSRAQAGRQAPKRAQPPARAQTPAQRPNQALQQQVAQLTKRVNQLSTKQATRVDPRLLRFGRAVANPFQAGALSSVVKGIFDASSTNRSAVMTRRAIITVELPKSAQGVDIVVPLCTRVSPFVQYGYNWDTTLEARVAGADTTIELSETTMLRSVAAGVRISYNGTMSDCGGKFYHFPSYEPEEAASGANHEVSPTVGSAYGLLKRAISSVPVPLTGYITFVQPPRIPFVKVCPETAPVAPVGGTFCDADAIRLYYVGPGGSYTFEVVGLIEYYNDEDYAHTTPTTNHIAGLATTQAIENALTLPLSNGSHVESGSVMARISGAIHSATGILGEVKQFAGEAYDFGKGVYNVFRRNAPRIGAAAVEEAEMLPLLLAA